MKKTQDLKKFLLIFIMGLFCINFISADWGIDNYKTFDEEASDYGKIEIWDTGQIGDDKKLVEHTLFKNTDQCLISCSASGTSTLYYDLRLFTDLEFKDRGGNNKVLSDSNVFLYETTDYQEEICEEEPVCDKGECYINRTNCQQVTKQRGKWVEYNGAILEGDLSGTKYTWKIKGQKAPTHTIDWIVESSGQKLDEWAWWGTNWNSKKQINITGAEGEDIENFTVFLQVIKEPGMQADYDDLRFVNASETGEFSYEIDYANVSDAGVWVTIWNLTSINSDTNTTAYMYYNNSVATVGENKVLTWGTDALAIYHFEETRSGFNDSSQKSNNLTFANGGPPNFDPSEFGTGVFMNKTLVNGEFQSASNAGFSGNDTMTFILLGKQIVTAEGAYLGTDMTGATPARLVQYVQTLGTITLEYGTNINNAVDDAQNQLFIAGTWTGSDTYSIYNKVLRGTGTTIPTLADSPIRVGNRATEDMAFNGTIDEVRIYNSSKGSSWINRTMDNNASTFFKFGGEENFSDQGLVVIVNLNKPDNHLVTINSSILFEANFTTVVESNLTNATLFLWHPNNSEFGTNFTTITGVSNVSNLTLSNIIPGNGYQWNFLGCTSNTTASNCSFAASNRTLNISVFEVVAETFSLLTTEGNTEEFQINITTENLPVSVATLIYNNTEFAGTVVNTAGFNFTITRSLVVPNVAALANITFFWEIELAGGFSANSTENNQTVQAITIDNCGTNTVKLINFTIVDEEFQTFISNTNTNMSIAINISSSDRTSSILTLSNNYTEINPVEFCLSINLTDQTNYLMDATVKYSATDYATEYYNIRDFTVNNITTPETIILYDLLTADSTEFKITFTDSDFIPVENALVFIERQYVSEDTFKTVELPLTDSNGETVGHFVRNDIVYNIRVVKNNAVIGLFQNIRAFCDDFTIGACTIPLEASSNASFGFDYSEEVGLLFPETPVYDPNASTMSFSFSTTSGNTETVFMNVTRRDVFGNQSLCTDSLTSASGTLICFVNPAIDDTTLVTTVSIDGIDAIISNTEINRTGLGSIGYLMWFVLSLLMILMVGEHKTGVFIGMLISYVGALSLGLIAGTLVGIGSAGVWFIVVTIMGIYKLNKDRVE